MHMINCKVRVSVTSVITLIFTVSLSFAQSNDQVAKQIFSEVFSPFCPGRALADCPSSSAAELKTEIRKRISAGASETEIKTYLFTLYGDEISALPPRQGFGALAWIAPFAFLALGAVIAVIWLAKRRSLDEQAQLPVLDTQQADLLKREHDSL